MLIARITSGKQLTEEKQNKILETEINIKIKSISESKEEQS